MQVPPEQVRPPLHWLVAQQAWPAPPQPAQLPDARHRSPVEQSAPTAAQVLPSQQPEVQIDPGQQVLLLVFVPPTPQATQRRSEVLQASDEPQLSSPQQLVPGKPQRAQTEALQKVLAVVQAPPQQGMPLTPQFPGPQ